MAAAQLTRPLRRKYSSVLSAAHTVVRRRACSTAVLISWRLAPFWAISAAAMTSQPSPMLSIPLSIKVMRSGATCSAASRNEL